MAVGFPTKVNYATGDVLSATNMNDLSGTVNLLESAQYAAGKNKIINGDFGINQRGFTSTTSDNINTFDRWRTFKGGGGTSTYSAETFTPGAAPVAGYEGKNFTQLITASQSAAGDYSLYINLIESVRTLAGQTATISFWAKASSGTPKIAGEMFQHFGTGGAPSSNVSTAAGAVTISTSWARYSLTVAVPSISGKTIGTNNNDYLGLYFWFSAGSSFASRASSIGNQNNTFQIWGVQLENGSTASPFQTATGNPQSELAACQRYYVRKAVTSAYGRLGGFGVATATNQIYVDVTLPVNFRTSTVSIDYGGALGVASQEGIFASFSSVTNSGSVGNNSTVYFVLSSGSMTVARSYYLQDNAAGTAYLGFSAEL